MRFARAWCARMPTMRALCVGGYQRAKRRLYTSYYWSTQKIPEPQTVCEKAPSISHFYFAIYSVALYLCPCFNEHLMQHGVPLCSKLRPWGCVQLFSTDAPKVDCDSNAIHRTFFGTGWASLRFHATVKDQFPSLDKIRWFTRKSLWFKCWP